MGRATVQNGRSFAYALENPMDIMTGVGLVCGIIVVSVMILMGGDLHMFISEHAALIVIGGASPPSPIPLSPPAVFCWLALPREVGFPLTLAVPRRPVLCTI